VENALDDQKRRMVATIQNPYENLKKSTKVKEVRDFKVVVKAEDWKFLANKMGG
jgi:hypothetical protein